MGKCRLRLPEVIVILQNFVRPRTEFLIGAVKLQQSITRQMCHLNVILTFFSFDCRLEDIECGKYEIVSASAEKVLVKPYFSLMKKTATPFHPCQFVSNTLWRVNLQVQSFVASKYRLRLNGRILSNGRKLSNRLTAAIPKDFRSETIIRVEQISAHISDRAGGFVEAISHLAKKKTASLFYSPALRVFVFVRELSVFNLTHFHGCLLIACSHLPLKIEKNIYMYISKKKKKGLVLIVNVIKASTSKVPSFFISQCLNRTFILIQQSTA